jgi:ferrous iron transport protein A
MRQRLSTFEASRGAVLLLEKGRKLPIQTPPWQRFPSLASYSQIAYSHDLCDSVLFAGFMTLSDSSSALPLDQLPRGQASQIVAVTGDLTHDPIARRLYELGFEEGMSVTVTHVGPLGGNPIAVKIGAMTVALRRAEAARVQVSR